jgi:Fic family protein
MTGSDIEKRDSQAESAYLIHGEKERAAAEARNGLRQFDHAMSIVETHLDPERPFKLRPSHLLGLHRTALEGIHIYAGNYRPGDVRITHSKHTPPAAYLVPALVEDLCEYVNKNWHRSPIHLAAYVMWRLNWIHPFSDGNGRTSRMVSFLVLCLRAGYRIPGRRTIPEQIEMDRKPYFAALDAADEAARQGKVDISKMEELLGYLLAEQLYAAWEDAKSGDGSPHPDI